MKKQNETTKKQRIPVQDLAVISLMAAVIEVSKLMLAQLPNVELTTFWLIMFTLFFGGRVVLLVPVLILLEGCIYGYGLWWFMYLYIWPLLVLLAWFFRRRKSVWVFALLSGGFGLCFGALCAIPYLFIGAERGGNLTAGLHTAFTWWVAGIPWDIAHCIANFVLMLVLYRPIRYVMIQLSKGR